MVDDLGKPSYNEYHAAGRIRCERSERFSCTERGLFPAPQHEKQKNITMAMSQKMKGQKCHEVRFYLNSGQKRA